MKQRWKQGALTALMLLALCAGLLMPSASTHTFSGGLTDLCYLADEREENTAVFPQQAEGGLYLFLPAPADLTGLKLWFGGEAVQVCAGERQVTVSSGRPFDLTALFDAPPEDGKYAVTLERDGETAALTIMSSASVGSLYLTSPDGDHDRAWVEADRGNRAAEGGVVLLRPDGTKVYGGTLKSIKGRGHSTWHYPKKPYQIKLNEKVDLLETGDPAEAASTWVLLANYNDETLIHNSLTYDMALALGLPYSPHSRTVDLYYDGQYRGTYLLCEKTEVGTGRVDIGDLEKKIEKLNPGIEDFDLLDTRIAATEAGVTYQYVSGLTMPGDISGGYLLELDMKGRAMEEKSWFATSYDSYVVCKSPEYLSARAMEYIGGLYQEFEDAVYHGGVNPNTGKDYSEYVDAASLAKCYLLMELSQDGDAFLTSTYFYKPEGEDKLYAGPVWDFDYTYGLFGSQSNGARLSDPEGLTAAFNSRFTIKLLSIPAFQQEVRRVYEEELYALVANVALGDAQAQAGFLRSIVGYGAQCSASQEMNRVLWTRYLTGSYGQALDKCREFLFRRNEWLYAEVMGWTGEPLPNERFVDVPESAWYFDAVNFVERQGLFVGVSATRFNPHGTMTRSMAATVLHRLADLPEPPGASTFSDVPEDMWYSGAVAWAESAGLLDGFAGGRFYPERAITRQELVAMLYRWAGAGESVPIPERYADRDQVSAWARDAFGWAIGQGVILGVSDTELAPGREVSRCEAAAILQRFAIGQGL